jgi:DNA-binding CsgD family transcriptional regulator
MALKKAGSRIFQGGRDVLPHSCVTRSCDGEFDCFCKKMKEGKPNLYGGKSVKQARSAAENRREGEWAREGGREWSKFSNEVRLLVRQLVERIEKHGADPAADLDAGVILDMQVDGVRCVLVRRTLEPDRPEAAALSPREREIARMVAKGYPNKVIARVLEISSWTVSTHLRRIFAKLSVSSRAAMVAHLLEDGGLGEGRPAAR